MRRMFSFRSATPRKVVDCTHVNQPPPNCSDSRASSHMICRCFGRLQKENSFLICLQQLAKLPIRGHISTWALALIRAGRSCFMRASLASFGGQLAI